METRAWTLHTGQPTQSDAEIRCRWQFFGVNAVQRCTPGAVRCTTPSWTSEVRMPELAACQSAQVQAVLAHQRWARRFRRLTLLPWPIPQVLQLVGLVNSLAEMVVAACAQAMSSSCPRLVLLAQVRDCARCPFGRRLAPPCFVHDDVVEGAVCWERVPFPAVGSVIPLNIFGHSRWTSHKHRCMHHRHSVLHWSNMSRNQSRTMGSAWILWRFAVLPLGSSSASSAAGVAGAAGAAQGCWCGRLSQPIFNSFLRR